MRAYVVAILLTGCAVDAPGGVGADEDAPLCTRVQGEELGQRLTVPVRTLDAVREVTFMAWRPKLDGPGQVGFTLDTAASFVVKADFNTFHANGFTWQNPFGERGSLAIPIDYVDVCDAYVEDEPNAAP